MKSYLGANQSALRKLEEFGQSIWLDFIQRGMIESGELTKLIHDDGITGITSNPSIFEKAIAGSNDYDSAIRALALQGKDSPQICKELIVQDVKNAAKILYPIFKKSEGRDGFISLEVSPHLARDTQGTIKEARELWASVNCPNVMIKVPGTVEGLPAIKLLISEGINVNITLLFSVERYREIVEAYLSGLELREKNGRSIAGIASVASFFLSRIDVLIDPSLEQIIKENGSNKKLAESLHGQVAIQSAKAAYQIFMDLSEQARFKNLKSRGAQPQRLLWASTSTKNPQYSDVLYIESLIGSETVNTVPLETLTAYQDHGLPELALKEGIKDAAGRLESLKKLEINLSHLTDQLEEEGIEKFKKSYKTLLASIEKKRDFASPSASKENGDPQTFQFQPEEDFAENRIEALSDLDFNQKLWNKNASLWKADEKNGEIIRNAMGWLDVPEKMEAVTQDLLAFKNQVVKAGYKHVLHMGMGGSSLAPLVFAQTFEKNTDALALTILDTTDPKTILDLEKSLSLAETLFIVATKSGTTAEPLAFLSYFYDQVKAIKGAHAGENFVGITDPDTHLAKLASELRFRRVFLNFKDIGGRYSALSYFGLVPATLMGVDVRECLVRALTESRANAKTIRSSDSPGVRLGAAIGEFALRGRDKLTFVADPSIKTLGMWLEQLIAESTGKDQKGVIPIADELLGTPKNYSEDRVFVNFRMTGSKGLVVENQSRRLTALIEAGHPVITIDMKDPLDLGAEFFRWEIATATIGSVLKINPFDQPNVQESKDNTDRILAPLKQGEKLTEKHTPLVEDGLSYFGQSVSKTAEETLKTFFKSAHPGDYVSLMAYLTETPDSYRDLQDIRIHIRDSLLLATTLGYGPRFLHSTGQLHKGGPNTGLFLQLTAENEVDVKIPGSPFSFATMKQAQSVGDLEALEKHGRRCLRVHLGKDIHKGLRTLGAAIAKSLKSS